MSSLGLAGAIIATLAVTTQAAPVSVAAPPEQNQLKIENADQKLGAGWRESPDVLVNGIGDTNGFHLTIAREKDAFQWSTLASLSGLNPNGSPWTGVTCLTGSGKYAVAVYAPIAETNKPESLQSGARAAIVDVATGKGEQIANDVALSYFSAGCGIGDEVLLYRSIGQDEQETDLIRVDAARKEIVSTTRLKGQLTNMVPTADGPVALTGGNVVKVENSGVLTKLAKLDARPFAVVANQNGIDLLSKKGDRAIGQRLAGGKLTTVADAPLRKLQLFGMRGGRSAFVGDVASVDKSLPGISTFASDRKVESISADGHLLVERSVSAQVTDATKVAPGIMLDPTMAGRAAVSVRVTKDGSTRSGEIQLAKGPRIGPEVQAAPTWPNYERANPSCAVIRNDLRRQALQPTATMVEWAVNQAVYASLTTQRPANYLASGLPAYSPQGMFPRQTLSGGGTIPAQVYLGILAQESNFRQATWHARPGDAGNPLVGDYYGLTPRVDDIDYKQTDCGYGIGQVTDGMKKGQTTFTPNEQGAIAVDYAANLSAGMRILAQKWNQIYATPMKLNGGSSGYIENWFYATWAYNSGFYPPGTAGNWGIGWFNNPANPRYQADRDLFLRGDEDADAKVPFKWGYPEKILGWIEHPQRTYFMKRSYEKPNGGLLGQVFNPDLFQFCNSSNQCSEASPCPAETFVCWFHEPVDWARGCTQVCSTENAKYAIGAPEPAMDPQYPRMCAPPSTPGVIVVDDIPDSSVNALGCAGAPRGGKFTLRTGGNSGPETYVAQVDLHSYGAGYKGHMWFTHSYDDGKDPDGYLRNKRYQVVGTWTPDLPAEGQYRIDVHLPTHGADALVTYLVFPGPGLGIQEFKLQQKPFNGWVPISPNPIQLKPGARIMMSNMIPGGTGDVNVLYDAMSFRKVG